jgi:predicted GNAT superfamily acetyltransferase
MVGANLHGGLVLGAFRPDGQAAAISFGFLGRLEERLCFYSQLTGVVPEYQSLGLGYALKLAQREFCLGQGLTLMVWAFDPLQEGNARFNLHRLGATVRRYIDNMYGERTDSLSAGVATDRVIAEWQIDEEPGTRVTIDAEAAARIPRLIHTEPGPLDFSVPTSVETALTTPRVLLEIPSHIAHMRRDHPETAERWRLAVRQGFQTGLAAGYQAVGIVRDDTPGRHRYFYVLEQHQAPDGSATV